MISATAFISAKHTNKFRKNPDIQSLLSWRTKKDGYVSILHWQEPVSCRNRLWVVYEEFDLNLELKTVKFEQDSYNFNKVLEDAKKLLEEKRDEP